MRFTHLCKLLRLQKKFLTLSEPLQIAHSSICLPTRKLLIYISSHMITEFCQALLEWQWWIGMMNPCTTNSHKGWMNHLPSCLHKDHTTAWFDPSAKGIIFKGITERLLILLAGGRKSYMDTSTHKQPQQLWWQGGDSAGDSEKMGIHGDVVSSLQSPSSSHPECTLLPKPHSQSPNLDMHPTPPPTITKKKVLVH